MSLSSGEAELYALTKLCSQLLMLQSIAQDFGLNLEIVARCDSSAAMGISHRVGLGGRARHIRVQDLWVQEKVARKIVKIRIIVDL